MISDALFVLEVNLTAYIRNAEISSQDCSICRDRITVWLDIGKQVEPGPDIP